MVLYLLDGCPENVNLRRGVEDLSDWEHWLAGSDADGRHYGGV